MKMNEVSNEDVNLMIDILSCNVEVCAGDRWELEERLRDINLDEDPYEVKS